MFSGHSVLPLSPIFLQLLTETLGILKINATPFV